MSEIQNDIPCLTPKYYNRIFTKLRYFLYCIYTQCYNMCFIIVFLHCLFYICSLCVLNENMSNRKGKILHTPSNSLISISDNYSLFRSTMIKESLPGHGRSCATYSVNMPLMFYTNTYIAFDFEQTGFT